MKISHNLLKQFKKSKIIRIEEVPLGHYTFEYAKEHYANGTVFGIIELENEIISDLDNKIIGYFGVNLEHNILAYYLKI
jgi:Fe2+ or Zn2+ uptake regulation protein